MVVSFYVYCIYIIPLYFEFVSKSNFLNKPVFVFVVWLGVSKFLFTLVNLKDDASKGNCSGTHLVSDVFKQIKESLLKFASS